MAPRRTFCDGFVCSGAPTVSWFLCEPRRGQWLSDAGSVARLWRGGLLPPKNDYRVVQLKSVPYQELLISSSAFKAFKRDFAPHLLGIERWMLKDITIGQLSRYLHELNPLLVKLDPNAGHNKLWPVPH